MNELLPALASLIGVIVGAIVAIVTTRLTIQESKRVEQKKINIEKLEELYKTISLLKDRYRGFMANLLYAPDKLGDDRDTIPIDQIEMLVGFYVPEAKPELQRLENARQEFAMAAARIVVAASHEDFTSEFVQESKERIGPLFSFLERSCDEFQLKVAQVFRERMKIAT